MCFLNIAYLVNCANIFFRYLSLSLSVCVGFYLFTPEIMVCIFQGHTSKYYVIPGREIPKWFEELNICYTLVDRRWDFDMKHISILKVKLQLPLVGDNPRGIALCLIFLPDNRNDEFERDHVISVDGLEISSSSYLSGGQNWLRFKSEGLGVSTSSYCLSDYSKVESHHLWLGKIPYYLPETPGCSIDKNGFHQVELEISTEGLQVEKIGFRVV